ncbi:MAG: hypothetical protein P8080_07815 [Gammaproteobacteria bacterium]
MRRLATLAVLWALLAACAGPRQASPRLTPAGDTPSGWVDAELAPVLAQRLAGHPRFAGQALVIGLPAGVHPTTRLEDRLNRMLESRLMHAPGLRLAAAPDDGCARGDYQVGFAVSPAESAWRVELRVLEVASGEWVTGVADSWEGPLSRRDLADQGAPATVQAAGSRARPFDASEQEPLARSLARGLSCQLVAAGLETGPVAASPDAGPLGARIAALLAELPHPRGAGPSWRLSVERRPLESGLVQVTAVLGTPAASLRISRHVADSRVVPIAVPASSLPASSLPAPILSTVACGPGCAGVHLRAAPEAALFAVGPGGVLENAAPCAIPGTRLGGRLIKMNVAHGEVREFLAVTAAADYAPRLEAILDRAPPGCGRAAARGPAPTLRELERLAAEAGPGLAWTRLYVDAGLPRRGGRWR